MISYLPESIQKPYVAAVEGGFEVYKGTSVLAISRIMKTCTWSPIIWDGGVRSKKNFVCAHYAALDFENPEVAFEDMTRNFCDTWAIAGPSRNNRLQKGDQPPMDRFRLLLRFERPITSCEEYEYNIRLLVSWHGADPKCVDGARLFFPCTDITFVNCGDDLLDEPVRTDLDAMTAEKKLEILERHKESITRRASYGLISKYATKWLSSIIPLGERNTTCFRIGADLCRAGVDYEAAVQDILASPTYAVKNLSPKVILEIRKAVSSGYKRVTEELSLKK